MYTNVFTAIGSSTAITFALLYLMNLLIGFQANVLVEPRERRPIDFTRVPPLEEVRTERDRLPDKSFIDPPVPPAQVAPGNGESGTAVRLPRQQPPPVNDNFGLGVPGLTGPLVLLVRPQPGYPAAALRAELEGWVLVQFDVLANGTVANIEVIESSDPIFESSAKRAAAKLRFKPVFIEGVPQVTEGVQNIFRYRMEK